MNTFKSLLCERFLFKTVKITSMSFDVKLVELRQRSDESLHAYYKRVINFMQRVEVKNRTLMVTLTLLESIMLNIILRVFIKNLVNTKIRKKITRDMTFNDRNLKTIYNLIEKARHIKIEMQKLFEKELKQNELTFYKNLAQKNIFKYQIQALLTSYHVDRDRSQFEHQKS